MSKFTPPAPAGEERLTVKVTVAAPELPSFIETSLIERKGVEPAPSGVSEKSSTPSPSSELGALKSSQRMKNVAPLAILRPVIAKLMVARLAAALPSNAPALEAVLIGLVKSRELTSFHVPVIRLVASTLY